MEATLARIAEMQSQPTHVSKPKSTRKSRRQTEEGVRYFLAKDGSTIEKPELGAEVEETDPALDRAERSAGTDFETFRPAERIQNCSEVAERAL